MRGRARRLAAGVTAVLALVVLAACGGPEGGDSAPRPHRHDHGPGVSESPGSYTDGQDAAAAGSRPPNVIFFLTDDLDWKLMRWLPNVQRDLVDEGTTFRRYYVEESTCCTSRATIFTGEYAHNHGVFGNTAPQGGYAKFHKLDESTALPTWLGANPGVVERGLMGKYLNEYPFPYKYQAGPGRPSRTELGSFVPPGWDTWAVPANGQAYSQDHYELNIDGRIDRTKDDQFLDRNLGDRLLHDISADGGASWRAGGHFMEWASYAPHLPYAHPKSQDKNFRDVTYPRTPAFNEKNTSDKFGEAGLLPRLTPAKVAKIDSDFRNRIRALQVLDWEIKRVVAELKRTGALDDTYLVFSSDNGYHMGEHRLPPGKYTQFETDVRVPLIVRGPGIAKGRVVSDLAGNIDLAETFAAMTHTPVPSDVTTDGLSLLPLLTGQEASLPRKYLLIGRGKIPLYKHAPLSTDEPPETYVPSRRVAALSDFTGVVGRRWKLIQYDQNPHHEELYDLVKDPDELTNLLADGRAALYAQRPGLQPVVSQLTQVLRQLRKCHGADCTID